MKFPVVAALAALPLLLHLYGPDNMVFDSSGNMYLTDSDHASRSRLLLLSPAGGVLWQWSGFTNRPGERNGPEGIALDAHGNLFVTDGESRIVKIARGSERVSAFGERAGFSALGHIAIDRSGDVYVSEGSRNRITKLAADGTVRAVWQRPFPETIACSPDGNLVVEEWRARRITILSLRGDVLRTFGSEGRGPGQFLNSAGLAVDRRGNIYVADIALHRLQIFDEQGRLLRTIKNSPGHALFTEGPSAIAVDAEGNLYSPDGMSVVKYNRDGRVLARWS